MEARDSEREVDRSKSSTKVDYSGKEAWLDAHVDPVASLYTFSSCIGELLP